MSRGNRSKIKLIEEWNILELEHTSEEIERIVNILCEVDEQCCPMTYEEMELIINKNV